MLRVVCWLFLWSGPLLAADGPVLPKEWHGTWKGKLVITNPSDKNTDVAMVLKIEPIKDARELTWAITYGDGPKASTRDYKMVPDGERLGRLKIDEKNGIILDARVVGPVITSTFELSGSLLTARYELRGDILLFEITSLRKAKEKTGGGQVQGYTVEVVQRAELKK